MNRKLTSLRSPADKNLIQHPPAIQFSELNMDATRLRKMPAQGEPRIVGRGVAGHDMPPGRQQPAAAERQQGAIAGENLEG